MEILDKIESWLTKEDLETRLFFIALLFSVPYFGSSIIFNLISDASIHFILLDGFLLSSCIIFFLLSRNRKRIPYLITIFCVMLLGGFIIYWKSSAGIRGGGAYIFSVLSVLIILMSQGRFRIFLTLVTIGLVFFLTSNLLTVDSSITYDDILFDFIMNLSVLAIILIIFKRALDLERKELRAQNKKMDKLNKELARKSSVLASYNYEIQLLQQNLEHTVDKRTKTLARESELVVEYAFINAHLVRAPIANIIGITELVGKESPEVEELQQHIKDLDEIVRKIGGVLNQN